MNPDAVDKYLYVDKTPTWIIRAFYSLGILSWSMAVYGYVQGASTDPMYLWVVLPAIAFFSLYTLSSFGLNLFYKQFDLPKHLELMKTYWSARDEPSVDIFLPICGEDMDILKNTWKYVNRLRYANRKVYVLDDSSEFCLEHRLLAEQFGFIYLERPNKGEMKKAGNLKYGFERSSGEYIAIFDADFAPRSDFIQELLPYMSDKKVGIVQSPQYFELSQVGTRSALEYGAANIQESFYRFIQVVRDRFGATICCGSNALYRRSALDEIGGTVQAGHSEDQKTGFALQNNSWIVRYVPIILAVGLCPDTLYPYFNQQHRWCSGNIELMLSKDFWGSALSWKAKYSYITGFLFYLHHILAILFSLQIFWWLLTYDQSSAFSSGLYFFPYLLFTLVYIGFFSISRFRFGSLYALSVCSFSYSHAILSTLLRRSAGWVATGAKQTNISHAFRQTTSMVSLYVLAITLFGALSIRHNKLLLLQSDFFVIEFWILYSLLFSFYLLAQMYAVMASAKKKQVALEGSERPAFFFWRLKTVGSYSVALLFFLGISTMTALSGQPETIDASNTPRVAFLQNHRLNDSGLDILSLQQFLNAQGFSVSESGPGSAGNETIYFSTNTFAALKNFQKSNNLPETGYFGPDTRRLINALS